MSHFRIRERPDESRIDRGQIVTANLQNFRYKPLSGPALDLRGGVRMNGLQHSAMTGVEKLQKVEDFAAANPTQDDSIAPVAECGPRKLSNLVAGIPFCFRLARSF